MLVCSREGTFSGGIASVGVSDVIEPVRWLKVEFAVDDLERDFVLIRRGTAFKWISAFNFEPGCIKKSSDTTIKTDDCYKFDKLTIVEKRSGLCERRFIQRGTALQLLARPANEIFGGGESCYCL